MPRRATFFGLVGLTTLVATASYLQVVAANRLSFLDIALVLVFMLLAAWLSQSFWTLTAGFIRLAFRRTPPRSDPERRDHPVRVAVLLLTYNEDPVGIFARAQAMREALARHRQSAQFDLFVLSDTTDADTWLREVAAWDHHRAATPEVPLYYRRRLRNTDRKTGNVGDWVERFGAGYRHMLLLDADSVMTGAAVAGLVERIEQDPRIGLVQAPPRLTGARSLFARMLQFATDVYGPLYPAGMAYWAADEGNYWGHNAIIRIDAFVESCKLPRLAGSPPFGGLIMSHDFVEAALLRRAGWRVLMADDLDGSYEEPPQTFGDFLKRDRRWAQGNLQHLQILLAEDLHWVSRLHLGIGIMAYVSSPLWLLFLLLSAGQGWVISHIPIDYFSDGSPIPRWPISMETEATALLITMLGLLFLPKLWGLLLLLKDGRRRRAQGGAVRACLSVLLESLYSALIAPIMMLIHTGFIGAITLGGVVDWRPQDRRSRSNGLQAMLRRYGWVTLIGLASAYGVHAYAPVIFFWLFPVFVGLLLAPILIWLGDRIDVAESLRSAGFLLARDEGRQPAVLARMRDLAGTGLRADDLFADVVRNPRLFRRHRALLPDRHPPADVDQRTTRLCGAKALLLGLDGLERAERRQLLEDPEVLEELHQVVWLRSLQTTELPPVSRTGIVDRGQDGLSPRPPFFVGS